MNDPARDMAAQSIGEPGTGDVGPKRYFDGAHRTCVPQETLARVRPLLPTLGITRVANVTGLDRTGIPVVLVCRPNSRSVTISLGKGLTLDAAKASGIMEALEVWHAERIMAPLKLASYAELRAEHRVVDVTKLPLSHDSRFSADLSLLWLEGDDLFGAGRTWVPYELVSTNYTLPSPTGSGCFQSNTNGLASGNHWLEAVCHAICEVVERDATALWSLMTDRSRAARALDPSSVDDPACRHLLALYERAGLSVRIWETTTDIGIASFYCALLEPDGDDADPEFGAGCHPARGVALVRALTEAAQARTGFIAGARDDHYWHLYEPAARASRRFRFASLLRASAEFARTFANVPNFESRSVAEDLRWILARLQRAGLDQVIAVDLSRPDIGIPVVRVIVPGLEGASSSGDYAPGVRARRLVGTLL